LDEDERQNEVFENNSNAGLYWDIIYVQTKLVYLM